MSSQRPRLLSRTPTNGRNQVVAIKAIPQTRRDEVLQSHLAAIRDGTAPLNCEIEKWQDLEKWLHDQIELQKSFKIKRGCPFGTIGNEITDNDELVRQDLNLILR